MGAIGTSRLSSYNPDSFDSLGTLGGPLDAALLLHNIEYEQMGGGFCTSAQLEAAAALDAADHGNRLDRPDGIAGCNTQADAAPVTNYGRLQRFNHWAFTVNGGHFDRSFYLDVFTDLTEAFGNPLSSNPNSPALAAPMTPADFAAASCANPFVLHNVHDRTYSPNGEHNAITFCDGQPPVMLCDDYTLVDWCAAAALNGRQVAQDSDADTFCAAHGGNAHQANQSSTNQAEVDVYFNHEGEHFGCYPGNRIVPFALAIDINGNGVRDYNEPLLKQGHEPFSDVGTDGCPDNLEDGKGGCTTAALSPFDAGVKDPNGDNYDPTTNPAGTEGNFVYDVGEPFQDVGLDGVDRRGRRRRRRRKVHHHGWLCALVLARSPDPDRHLQRRAQGRDLNFYLEGGIRDVFDLGAQAEATSSAVLRFTPAMNRFNDFPDIPTANGLPLGRRRAQHQPRERLRSAGDGHRRDRRQRAGAVWRSQRLGRRHPRRQRRSCRLARRDVRSLRRLLPVGLGALGRDPRPAGQVQRQRRDPVRPDPALDRAWHATGTTRW